MRLAKLFVPTLVLAITARSTMADVVAVVSSNSAITTLSKNQISDIFLGRSARFPDGRPAVPLDQAEGTALRDEFYANFTGKTAAQMKAYWSKILFTGRGQPPKAVSDNGQVKQWLATNPSAIGYIARSAVDSSVKVLNSDRPGD